jgi:hypothetical protein
VADRYHSYFLNELSHSGEEAELADQLTALAASRPTDQRASRKKVARGERKSALPKSSKSYLSTAAMQASLLTAMANRRSMIADRSHFPSSMPMERMKAVIFKSGTIGDVVAKMKQQADEYRFDMSKVQTSTFGSLYYMRLINEALSSIALLPTSFADPTTIAKIREQSVKGFTHDCQMFS